MKRGPEPLEGETRLACPSEDEKADTFRRKHQFSGEGSSKKLLVKAEVEEHIMSPPWPRPRSASSACVH